MLFLDISIITISSLTRIFSITRNGLGRMRKKSHEGSVRTGEERNRIKESCRAEFGGMYSYIFVFSVA